MPKLRDNDTITERIYPRKRGDAAPRYYGDFRDYADVGGGQEPLSPEGSRYATTCPDEAKSLATARLEALQEKRAARPKGPAAKRRLEVLIPDHLERKAMLKESDPQWLGNVQVHLETAEDYFGASRDIAEIEVPDLEEYRAYLMKLPNGRGGTLSDGSVAHYLNSLSNLYKRAIAHNLLKPGANPVQALPELQITREETPFLEVPEMAEILRYAVEDYVPARPELAIPFFPTVLATLALTGGREAEVLGLYVRDVNLERGTIRFTPNPMRPRLKTVTSERTVLIFPQLAEFLRPYLQGSHAPKGELLFPSPFHEGEGEGMITELRKAYDKMPMPARLVRKRTPAELKRAEERRVSKLERALGTRRGPKPEESIEELQEPVSTTRIHPLRAKILRHTYCAARLQTTDHGKPIATYTVARELGHASTTMVEKVYGHLGRVRHRGEDVEYRW